MPRYGPLTCREVPTCRVIKSQKAEAMLPEFDIGRKVGAKIRLQRFRRAVVLCVVDVADFDGSLPGPRSRCGGHFPAQNPGPHALS